MRHYGYEKPIINTEYHGPTFFEFQCNLQYALIAATWINNILNPGAPKEQTDRIVRIAARDMVIRNCFIRAEGITTTMFWDLWHDNSNEYDFPYVMYAQLRMMDMRDGKLIPLSLSQPFARMTEKLKEVTRVKQFPQADQPNLYVFEVERAGRPAMQIVWERREGLRGEEQPPVTKALPWTASTSVNAVDQLGVAIDAKVAGGTVTLPVSLTPIYVEAH